MSDVPEKTENELVEENLRLVHKIANDFNGRGLPWEDLVAEGRIGLIKAAKKFDQQRGIKFSTYCAWWIKQAIQQAIANQVNTVRVPTGTAYKRRVVKRAIEKLTQQLDRDPTDEELIAETNLPAATVKRLRKLLPLNMISLNESIDSHDASGTELLDLFYDETESSPAEILANAEDTSKSLALLQQLPERYRQVLELRFGLNDQPIKTLEETASIMGCSNERVRQIQNQALKKLQQQLKDLK